MLGEDSLYGWIEAVKHFPLEVKPLILLRENVILKIMGKGKINPQLRQQIGQLSDEVVLKEDKPSFAKATEGKEDEVNKEDKEKIAQLKAQKEAWAKKRIKEIEDEVRLLAQKRQEEMRKRYEQKIEEDKQKEVGQQEVQKTQPLEISSKPQKGKPFWGRRIKTAQQQAQPETVGRRAGG